MFTISNHRLAGVPFVASPNHGGRIEPSLIVVHDTADRLHPDDTILWFANPSAKVSAHFVVARQWGQRHSPGVLLAHVWL